MQARNSTTAYGWVSIVLHWFMAAALIGMYVVGDYMAGLDYYDKLYHVLPDWHKAFGVMLGGLLLVRVSWLYAQPRPQPLASPAPAFSAVLAKLGHLGLYSLLLVILVSGYLIATAKGHGISVFGWFEIPALLPSDKDRGRLAGDVHEIAALLLVLLAGIHALAALAHHFYWKDRTLARMLGRP